MPKKSHRINKRRSRGTRKHGGGRGRGRARRMRMKGGLGPNDSTNIGLQGTYSFANPALLPDFRMFTFGTPSQYDAWNRLLLACRGRGIPVYILTSGNKIGIIRTLQLLGLDGEFVEVLCTQPHTTITDPKTGATTVSYNGNPPNASGQHNFQGQPKYQVIQQILTERGLNCQGPPIGYLLDDSGFFTATTLNRKFNIPIEVATGAVAALRAAGIADQYGVVHPNANQDHVRGVLAPTAANQFADIIVRAIARGRNSDHLAMCPAIQFVDVLSHKQTPPDFNLKALMDNQFYQLNVTRMGLDAIDGPHSQFNFTSIDIIEHVIRGVNSGNVQMLFVDFDQTFQMWEGAIPFEHPSVIGMFANKNANINVV